MKIKTAELTGRILDYAVALIENVEIDSENKPIWFNDDRADVYSPSSSWEQGGPIIEREKISIDYDLGGKNWGAECALLDEQHVSLGDTPLQAAMRCYVAWKLGDTVEIPEGL